MKGVTAHGGRRYAALHNVALRAPAFNEKIYLPGIERFCGPAPGAGRSRGRARAFRAAHPSLPARHLRRFGKCREPG